MNEKHGQIKKKVLVSGNDVKEGAYRDFLLNDYNDTELRAALVIGTAAVPFVFPAENLTKYGLDNLMVDAGFTWNYNMDSGIDECYKIDGIDHPSQIVVDVINLSPDKLP